MQIFVTDVDPQKCAFALDDKRVNKQILESAQILSSALHHLGMGAPDLYRPTHQNNPLILWAAKCRPNFEWLFTHAFCLSEEWSCRMGKVHASHSVIEHCGLLREGVPEAEFRTPFVNLTEFQDLTVVKAYRACLIKKWTETDVRTPKWSHRAPPSWSNSLLRVLRDNEGVYSVQR